jgi:hypothetical protein
MVTRTWLGLSLFFLGAAGVASAQAPADPKGKPPAANAQKTTSPEFQLAVWQAISGSSGAIDNCVARYVEQWPDRTGQASIRFEVAADGKIKDAKVETSLQQAYALTNCLRDVAKGWKLPAPGGTVSSQLGVKVHKGAKFSLLKPGEKPPEPKPGEPQPEGFMSFTPTWSEGG